MLGAHSPTEVLTEIHCHKSNLQVLQCHLGFLFVSTDCASHQWYEPSLIVPEIFLTLLVEFALHVICQRTSNCVFLSAQQEPQSLSLGVCGLMREESKKYPSSKGRKVSRHDNRQERTCWVRLNEDVRKGDETLRL